MLTSSKPCVAVCAVRTGSGKARPPPHRKLLRDAGKRSQYSAPDALWRPREAGGPALRDYADSTRPDATIEEREEYEPHLGGQPRLRRNRLAAILDQASRADVILWDGGNQRHAVRQADLHVVVAIAPAGHELRYPPGETNLRMADVCVVNKVDTAPPEGVETVLESIRWANPGAVVVRAASPFEVEENGETVAGKRVLAIEDGPTLTHGEMTYGAAVLAAKAHGAAELVDPRPFAVGSIAKTLEEYPSVTNLLPAMGYGRQQMDELKETIARSDADLVLIGTPIDLRRLVDFDKPALRVTYRLERSGTDTAA